MCRWPFAYVFGPTRYRTMQRRSYLRMCGRLRRHFISFLSGGWTFSGTNPARRDTEWRTSLLAEYRRSWSGQNYLLQRIGTWTCQWWILVFLSWHSRTLSFLELAFPSWPLILSSSQSPAWFPPSSFPWNPFPPHYSLGSLPHPPWQTPPVHTPSPSS